eukprot:3937044-Rhodomonas_salina.1
MVHDLPDLTDPNAVYKAWELAQINTALRQCDLTHAVPANARKLDKCQFLAEHAMEGHSVAAAIQVRQLDVRGTLEQQREFLAMVLAQEQPSSNDEEDGGVVDDDEAQDEDDDAADDAHGDEEYDELDGTSDDDNGDDAGGDATDAAEGENDGRLTENGARGGKLFAFPLTFAPSSGVQK